MKNSESKPDRRLHRALVEALGFMELDLPQRAVERLQQVADWGQDQFHWNLLLGEAWRGMNRFQEAVPPLERACRIAPEQLDIYLALGWCYKRTNQLPQAIRALETAHRLQPESDIVLYNLACYHALAGHRPEALDYLARAFRCSTRWRVEIRTETDFDNIRNDPDFQRLIQPAD